MAKPRAGKPTPSAPNKVFIRKDPEAWKKRGWTSAPNSIIHDPDMPPVQIWAWIWFASHTETFELNARALAGANKNIGRDKAYELVAALEERGLLLRIYERSETGVPYMVYDLQPEPVPVEQRTSKTRPRKSASKKREHPAKKARRDGMPDSWRVRNPVATSENDADVSPGLPGGQESGTGLHFPDGSGETPIPGGSVPGGSGESYKEDKTNGQDQRTKDGGDGLVGATVAEREPFGWLDASRPEQPKHDADPVGVSVLRSLPYGIGDALAGHAVTKWSQVVGDAIRNGMAESVVIDKLTADLPQDSRDRRVRIVVKRRLPDLQELIERTPTQPNTSTAIERAHADVTRMAKARAHGAREAAALLGLTWQEPERGNMTAKQHLLEAVPSAAREFVEQHRDDLVAALTGGDHARGV